MINTVRSHKYFTVILLALSLIFVLAACQENDERDENEEISSEVASYFPFTTTIEGREVTIEEKPQKIAALSLNVAETVMDLAGYESLVTVTNSMEQSKLSHFSKEAQSIKNKIAGATSLDPETVISYDPDLILLTMTHGAEEDASDMLTKAGIPLASFSRWVTIKDLMDNYKSIGQLIGEEEKADRIIEDMQTKINAAQELINNKQEKPKVLMLSQVGSNTGPYILGPSSIAYDLIQLAGGISGSDALGLEKTSPASIEHIIEMDPDYIILVEWSATSDEFTELVDSAAFQALTAVKNDKVKQIEAKDISQANRFIVDQLDDLVEWLNDDEE